ncbi:hypothetical protein ABC668_22865, partial [Pseudomonas aeruginosa]
QHFSSGIDIGQRARGAVRANMSASAGQTAAFAKVRLSADFSPTWATGPPVALFFVMFLPVRSIVNAVGI